MGRTKKRGKQFIDMKNAVTFKLVARSTDDPLFCDSSAPQYVLVEKKSKDVIPIELDDDKCGPVKAKLTTASQREEQAKFGVYFDDDYNYLQHLIDAEDVPTLRGIEIVDKPTYKPALADLLQEDGAQLMEPSTSKGPTKPRLLLPSSLFDSNVREKESLNKRAALPVGPQLDWDPDVVEAMDDDYNFEDPQNQIDDDFVVQAMKTDGKGAKEEDDSYLYDFNYTSKAPVDGEDEELDEDDDLSVCGAASGSEAYDSDEERDQFPVSSDAMRELMKKKNFKAYFGLEGGHDFDDGATAKTTGSHFTEYSMSSSVVRRNDSLRQLDDQFERMFIREYADEAAIGPLDGDADLEDTDEPLDEASKELMAAAWAEYEEAKEEHKGLEYPRNQEAIEYVRRRFLAKLKEAEEGKEPKEGDAESSSETSDSEYEYVELGDSARKGDKERLDCESVLSTFSNTNYHPKVLCDTDRYGNILLGRKARNFIRFDPRTGMPMIPDPTREPASGLTSSNLAKLQQAEVGTTGTLLSRISELSLRPKNETPEERRARKKELREFRAARRAEKKANRDAFNEEKIRMAKQALNTAVQKKVGVC